jgi:hypothetical protein
MLRSSSSWSLSSSSNVLLETTVKALRSILNPNNIFEGNPRFVLHFPTPDQLPSTDQEDLFQLCALSKDQYQTLGPKTFNLPLYYDHLQKQNAKRFGNILLYGDIVSSTQTILEK